MCHVVPKVCLFDREERLKKNATAEIKRIVDEFDRNHAGTHYF